MNLVTRREAPSKPAFISKSYRRRSNENNGIIRGKTNMAGESKEGGKIETESNRGINVRSGGLCVMLSSDGI